MALFKILSNMVDNNPPDPYGYINGVEDDGLSQVRSQATGLPSTFNQGYCYFDKSTGKFWIDTTPTTTPVTLSNKNDSTNKHVQGRIPINAYYADLAKVATSATYDGTGVSDSDKITSYVHGSSIDNGYLYLLNGNNSRISDAPIPLGSQVTIYKWTSTS